MTLTTNQRTGRTVLDLSRDSHSASELLRLSRIARELRLTDQILTDDMDVVNIVENGPAPAWTKLDGDEITFSLAHMPGLTSRVDVAVWLGTNAHEVGHNLFSPRTGSPLMVRVIEGDRTFMRGIAQLHNIAEDQRMERLLLARFSPWETYLTAALGHHLVSDNETAWLLMTGRTWLPATVRADARSRFVTRWTESVAAEVTALIGDYQHLSDPGDSESEEAWSILCQLHNIFDSQMPSLPQSCTVRRGGTPDTSGIGESGAAPASADEVDDESGDSDDAGDADESEPSKGAGDAGSPRERTKSMKQGLREAASDALDSETEAAEDLDSIMDALSYGRAGDEVVGSNSSGRTLNVTDAARRLHHEVGDALLDLKDESEPGWVKRVDSGRLSVKRLLSPGVDADQIFDRYSPGQMDSTEMDVVVLLDVSDSMASEELALAEAAWAIRSAVDDLDGRTTTITWSTGPHAIMARPGERPDDRMFVPHVGGGTDPTSALREAHRLLAGSSATNRLMILLTDGAWFRAGSAEQAIQAMNEEGIVTIAGLLGFSPTSPLDFHGCQHGAAIAEPAELARMFRTVAMERIRSHH